LKFQKLMTIETKSVVFQTSQLAYSLKLTEFSLSVLGFFEINRNTLTHVRNFYFIYSVFEFFFLILDDICSVHLHTDDEYI
jgi:hypothetical protein